MVGDFGRCREQEDEQSRMQDVLVLAQLGHIFSNRRKQIRGVGGIAAFLGELGYDFHLEPECVFERDGRLVLEECRIFFRDLECSAIGREYEIASIADRSSPMLSGLWISNFPVNAIGGRVQRGSEELMQGHFIPGIKSHDGLLRLESVLLFMQPGFNRVRQGCDTPAMHDRINLQCFLQSLS